MTPRNAHTRVRRSLFASVSLAAGLLAGCAGDDQAHQAALRDLQRQKELTAERDRQVQARAEELSQLKRRLAESEAAMQNAQRALNNATKSMEDLARAQAQAEARAAQFRKLVAQFRKMTEAGKLKVEIRDNRMIVSVGDKILFDPGKTQLKKEGAETLKEVTAVLKEVEGRDFQVAGHTDDTPIRSARFRSNWDLATARAVEVVNFMIASGMQPSRLSAAGYGAQAPVSPNDTAEGRSKNRRIEITLMPNLDDLPPITEDAPRPLAEDAKATPPEGAPAPAEGPPAPAPTSMGSE
jgi:chemotaxis protein MotB